jgi:hypothetical protein
MVQTHCDAAEPLESIIRPTIRLPRTAMPPQGWDRRRHLLRGGGTHRGKGRLQVQLRRAFIGHPFRSSSEVYDFTHARWRALKRPIPTLHRYSVWRILREIAEPVGRSRGPGRPWIWRLRESAAECLPPPLIEIIGELATWPILPILQTMFGGAGPRLDVGTAIGAAASRRPAGRVCVPQ